MTNGAAALFMRTAYQTAAIYFGDTPLAGGWAVRDQQVAHPLMVDSSQGQGFVQAAVAATERRFQAQRGYRAGRCRRTQGCVGQFEGGVGPAGQASVEAGAKAP